MLALHIQDTCGHAGDQVQALIVLPVAQHHGIAHKQQAFRHIGKREFSHQREARCLPGVLNELLLVGNHDAAVLLVDSEAVAALLVG